MQVYRFNLKDVREKEIVLNLNNQNFKKNLKQCTVMHSWFSPWNMCTVKFKGLDGYCCSFGQIHIGGDLFQRIKVE